jgi:hypothetical protein
MRWATSWNGSSRHAVERLRGDAEREQVGGSRWAPPTFVPGAISTTDKSIVGENPRQGKADVTP